MFLPTLGLKLTKNNSRSQSNFTLALGKAQSNFTLALRVAEAFYLYDVLVVERLNQTSRWLWAMPWSARSVPSSANAAYALGELFDITVHSRHALRPMVDSWVGWAVKWTRRFGDEWASQLRDVPLAVPVPVAASSASPPTQ